LIQASRERDIGRKNTLAPKITEQYLQTLNSPQYTNPLSQKRSNSMVPMSQSIHIHKKGATALQSFNRYVIMSAAELDTAYHEPEYLY
jgi:hypothetical protein